MGTTFEVAFQGVKKMDNPIEKKVRNEIRKELIKWAMVGLLLSITIGTATYLAWDYANPPATSDLNNSNSEQKKPLLEVKTKLAQSVYASFPEIVHVEILGNGTGKIYPDLLESYMDRIGNSSDYSWNVTAMLLQSTNGDVYQVVTETFVMSASEVNDIGISLFNAINSSIIKGIYGENPYTGELPSIDWGLKLYLANLTAYSIIVYEDMFVLLSVETLSSYNEGYSVTGAYVIEPTTPFQQVLNLLSQIYHDHLE